MKLCNDGINRLDKENQRQNFRTILGFRENEIFHIFIKEYSIVKRIKKIFKKQIINEQCRVKNYFIDLVFPVHELAIEIDENGHIDRSEIEEPKKRTNNKKKLDFILSELVLIKKILIVMMKLGKFKTLFMNLV